MAPWEVPQTFRHCLRLQHRLIQEEIYNIYIGRLLNVINGHLSTTINCADSALFNLQCLDIVQKKTCWFLFPVPNKLFFFWIIVSVWCLQMMCSVFSDSKDTDWLCLIKYIWISTYKGRPSNLNLSVVYRIHPYQIVTSDHSTDK